MGAVGINPFRLGGHNVLGWRFCVRFGPSEARNVRQGLFFTIVRVFRADMKGRENRRERERERECETPMDSTAGHVRAFAINIFRACC